MHFTFQNCTYWVLINLSIIIYRFFLSISEEAGTSKKPSKPGERPKGRPPNSVKNPKLATKKTSPKKTGVKKVGRPKNEDQNSEKGSPTGMLTKPDTARRVSTRSKKPGRDGKLFIWQTSIIFFG